jgi:hypothetical protein
MRPSEAFPEHGVDPLTPIAEGLNWLTTTAVHAVLGLLIGLAVARVMRMRHLHWSWGACGLLVLTLGRTLLGASSPVILAAALTATVSARRRHRHDLQTGGDLSAIAASRAKPLDLVRRAVESVALRDRARRGERAWFRADELVIGREQSGRFAYLPCGGHSGGAHTLVVGATGSGKTVTQTWIAVRNIERGHGAIVVDPKGDREMRDELAGAAMAAGRQFIEWTPSGPGVYNPYARGSETEIADKVLAGERFTEPHYLRQAQRYLGHAVRALRSAGREVSLRAIVDQLDPERLESLARSLDESDAHPTHVYLDSLTQRQRNDLSGIRDRLAILAESDVGVWLDPQGSADRESCPPAVCERPAAAAEPFDLLEAIRARAVVYFDLEADRRPLLSQMLGAAIVQDLSASVGALQDRPTPTLVVIDEFSAIAADQVVRLFGRARSAGVSLVLGTQELYDLRPPGREHLLEQVMGNLSGLVAHRQAVLESAELIAGLAGTRGAWRTSRHSDGRTTSTRTREPVLSADEVMSLPRGWAAVIVLSDGCRASIVQVFSLKQFR